MPGPSVRRHEDFRFITGTGRFTDDLKLPELAHAAIARSPHAHAVVKSLSVDAARAAPGVIAVLTAADAEADGIGLIKAAVNVKRPDGSDAPDTPRPLLARDRVRFVGSHGADGVRLIPETAMKAYERPPETLPRVQGTHEEDWIRACKEGPGGTAPSSPFEYGGALTEMVLLGVLAIRLKDHRLEWDSANLRFTNNEQANELLHITYRDGWAL